MTRLTDTALAEEIRKTLDQTGWSQHETNGDLAVDVTLERIAEKADDAEREAIRAGLWAVWNRQFEIWGV